MSNKIVKNYRLHQSDLDLIRQISEKQGGIPATRVIEKALFYYGIKLGLD
jgi:hypothetical protein